MRVRVLGSAAGGGFPQWNCACGNCALVRAGDPRVRARTQDSIAFAAPESGGGESGGGGAGWNLVNASPDIRAQIEATHALHPRPPRRSPIRSVLLTNGDLDHVLGLFSLRESTPLEVWATDAVRAGLEERNALMRTLHRFPEQLTWKRLELGRETPLGDGTSVEARPVAGKAPAHLTGLVPSTPVDNVALWIRHQGRLAIFAAACASLEGLASALDEADLLFLDGTFWSRPTSSSRPGSRARGQRTWPTSPSAGSAGASRASRAAARAPEDLRPREQLEPGPGRGLAGGRGGACGRLGGRARRDGDNGMTETSFAPEPLLARDEFLARLRAAGEKRYHDLHPFHVRMHKGELSRAQIQGWTLNRFYYQTRIPIKDALILSKSEDSAFRRAWIRRIHDHDGDEQHEGGLALWLRLAAGVGLDVAEVKSCARPLPRSASRATPTSSSCASGRSWRRSRRR